jgi:hypothetical protein
MWSSVVKRSAREVNYMREGIRAAMVISALWLWLTPMRAVGQESHRPTGSPCQAPEGAVVVRDGRVTIRADDQELIALLGELARCAPPLAVAVAPDLEAESVSIALADVPVDEALRRLVHAYDAFFYYAGAQASPVLAAVWVFPKGQGRALAPLDTTAWASDADVEKRLADPDPAARLRGLKALIERRGEGAVEALLTVLANGDDVVRAQALDVAIVGGLQVPPERLAALALSDPSPIVRLQALQYLPEGAELARVAEAAQHDPDPIVQLEAKSILERLVVARSPKAPPIPKP